MKESTKAIKQLQSLVNNLLHKDMICNIDNYPYCYQIALTIHLLVQSIICNYELTEYSKKQIIDIKFILDDYCNALDLFNDQPKRYTRLHIEQETRDIMQGLNADNKR